jgi:hypothetical protein
LTAADVLVGGVFVLVDIFKSFHFNLVQSTDMQTRRALSISTGLALRDKISESTLNPQKRHKGEQTSKTRKKRLFSQKFIPFR